MSSTREAEGGDPFADTAAATGEGGGSEGRPGRRLGVAISFEDSTLDELDEEVGDASDGRDFAAEMDAAGEALAAAAAARTTSAKAAEPPGGA